MVSEQIPGLSLICSSVERRAKGLCYNCNEKFASGHHCKKLFLVEGTDATPTNGETPKISIRAMSGIKSSQTMRVQGVVGPQRVIFLIDSGSTHNFIRNKVAKRVGLSPKEEGNFEVAVANYDAVLGAQWLSSLGPIMWDFSKLQMTFKVEFDKETKKNKEGLLLQIFTLSLQVPPGNSRPTISKVTTNPIIESLLQKYKDVFQKPKGLPIQRAQDHQIPLKTGS
ncbi:hypothetical protein AMTRI_Chr09g35350 [Amborella trichopoda]